MINGAQVMVKCLENEGVSIVFGYPGVGSLCYNAILQSDYNMILGIVSMSVVSIAVCTFIADLIYPLIDPRIRFK